MGTFHDDKGDLHGITVVVECGPTVYVGRCHEQDERGILLLDADEHTDGDKGLSKEAYLKKAVRFGVWQKHKHITIPTGQIEHIVPLKDVLKSSVATVSATMAESPAVEQPLPAPAAPSDEVVQLTEAAQEEVRRIMREESKSGLGLRLGVAGGGCSGFVYKFDFDVEKDGDMSVPFDGFKVYLDKKSTIYLRGITLDYQKGLSGRGFKFINPNATNTCGCGESFSV